MDYALPFLRAAPAVAVTHPGLTEDALRVRRLVLKRGAAIGYLGDRWVLHPHYRPDLHPHHNPSIKDSTVLKPVIDKARAEGRL